MGPGGKFLRGMWGRLYAKERYAALVKELQGRNPEARIGRLVWPQQ